MTVTTPVMRYFGGKYRLYPWLSQFFPPHTKYVEPFGGGGSVLLQKPRVYAEVYNDLDDDIVNVFRVLRDPELSKQLERDCFLTPYSRTEFELAQDDSIADPVESARRTIFRSCAGFGSATATKCRSGFRHDSNREWSIPSHVWARYPKHVQTFVERLQGVIIENRPARDVIDSHDTEHCLFYLDPPYVQSTRVMGGHSYYRYEMLIEDHQELLTQIKTIEGFAIISGYDSELYNDELRSWQKHAVHSRAAAHRGTKIATECIWLNPKCQDLAPQRQLFG